MADPGRQAVAVIGGGSIGVSWAVVFARAGHRVALHDTDPARLALALSEARGRIEDLHRADLLDEEPTAVGRRVAGHGELSQALADATHVQECVPEALDLKRELFARVEHLVDAGATLASSTSALMPSLVFGELETRGRCLVAHPANPPHLLPVVEVVPAPFTEPAAIRRVETLLADAGMSPVRVRVELEGFVFNRLQGALLREAYCLVRDGVADVEDVDRVVREGLGRRWAVVGPFETADLNTRGGIATHADRMGPAYARMGTERGQNDPWTAELVAAVVEQRRAILPLARWDERVGWRDRMLLVLERARRSAT